jgi:hypothetical protein
MSGSPKVEDPSPPKVVPSKVAKAGYEVISCVLPLQVNQPLGAVTAPYIMIIPETKFPGVAQTGVVEAPVEVTTWPAVPYGVGSAPGTCDARSSPVVMSNDTDKKFMINWVSARIAAAPADTAELSAGEVGSKGVSGIS